ncbi:hypothetical protein [Thiorhodovibrio frisius]|nr:hypothetical protein [Thiorhodovibrio frisius]
MTDENLGRPTDRNQRLEAALEANVPEIYFNGFTASIGVGDMILAIDRNGQPAAVLNISYTVAKTLAQSLSSLLATLEEKTGNSIMTTEEIAEPLMQDDTE